MTQQSQTTGTSTYPSTMRAFVLTQFGTPSSSLALQEVPTPEPLDGHVIIKIRAFGINHAEMHMRRGEWAEWIPIIGIECVGTVVSCPSGEFKLGEAVAALMGGLGRTVNGSYAEYTRVRVENVVSLGSADDVRKVEGGWATLAAIPESYATAWTCLFRNLELKKGDRLLIRGATSSFGRAAINLAVQTGAHVVATTRRVEEKAEDLKKLGVEEVIREEKELSQELNGRKFDAILELVGNTTVVDSLNLLRRGGKLCLAGWLGGSDPIKDFNPLLQMASGVYFSFFGSHQENQIGCRALYSTP